MNAAARCLSSSRIFDGQWKGLRFSRISILYLFLILAVIISALGLIYLKNLQRETTSQLVAAQAYASQLRVEWGQLLLEQSTWATPGRVQRIAEHRLKMHLPKRAKPIVIKE